ncbi:MAG: hypothetical protein KKC75_05370 [Nanoarchaeota archaeon]|nr:hypothetical protein [Nanoarchaeota archaeon]MBU1005024.1 hypothetical protein [Nanoarchaeota archaeon]MBU1945916.1 hypothetical protein [Nanoarchaeota archaeon]
MIVQTDLYIFGYKKGLVLPWCKRCEAENFYGNPTIEKFKNGWLILNSKW